MKDIPDGTSQTMLVGEGDSAFAVCHHAGCTLPSIGTKGDHRAIQVWINGSPGYDYLAVPGLVVVASMYAATLEPMNKRPVTDTSISLTGLNDCRSSVAGGQHTTSNFRSSHSGGCQFLFADGSCRFLVDNVQIQVYRAMSTMAGGEIASD